MIYSTKRSRLIKLGSSYICIFVCVLLLPSCSQAVFSPQQLNEKGYFVQAESQLNDKKNKSNDDQKEMLISLYGQHKYQAANKLLSSLDQSELVQDNRSRDIVLSLGRIAGNYNQNDLTNGLSSTEKEQFYSWPASNQSMSKVVLTKTPLLSGTEQFTGAHYDKDKEIIYLGKKTKKQLLGISHYIIESASYKNNLLLNVWKPAIAGADKDRAYTTSPTISSDNDLYFSMSLFEGISVNPLKMIDWNKDSLVNYLGIFSTTLENTNTIEPLSEKINRIGSNNTHPFILKDSILLFSSDRAGRGDMDIYYSIKKSGNWSEPKTLSMNTSFDDILPVSDGKNVYFSSKGHNNFGGYDVFRCKLNFSNGEITTGQVENMMQPFNSSSDDLMAVMLDENSGYLATNRDKESGDDIYHFTLDNIDILNSKLFDPNNNAVEGTLIISSKDENGNWVEESQTNTNGIGVVENISLKKSKEYRLKYTSSNLGDSTIYILSEDESNPELRKEQINQLSDVELPWIKAQGTVEDVLSNQTIEGVTLDVDFINPAGEKVSQTYKNNSDGSWSFDVLPGTNYNLNFSKEGYEDYAFNSASMDEVRMLDLIPMTQESKKGDKINIPNVYFDFNSAELKNESFPILENIISFLKDRPTMTVELSAHSDSKGSDQYNMALSKRRAKTCYDYLVRKNINPLRLKYKGYGETQLKNRCKNGVPCSEEEHAINRRMELKVITE